MSSPFASLKHVIQSRDPALNQRRAARDLVDLVSHMAAHGRTHGVRIINISPLGAMCRSEGDVQTGDRVTIWLPLLKDHPAIVRWVEDGRLGVEFMQPIAPLIYDTLMALIPPRQTAW